MGENATRSKVGRRRTPALTKDLIVASAVALANREGTNALTLRRLGTELGVDGTAFYRHFPDKDALILAVGDYVTAWVFARVREASDGEETWQDRIRTVADVAWQASIEFPGILSLTAARTTGQEAERRIVEMLLAIVAGLGLSASQTVLTYRMFGDTFLALTGQNGFVLAMEPELRQKDEAAWSRIYSVQSEHEFPATRRHLAQLIEVSEREIFAFTVENLVRGVEALLSQTTDPAAG